MISKVISGGQTGADRGGLDAAIQLGIDHGGACPKGRRSEDGKIPQKYQLIETKSAHYLVRTEKNVRDSHKTIVFTFGSPSGGSKETITYAKKHQKDWIHIDLKRQETEIIDEICGWLEKDLDVVVNVAGSRESKSPGIRKKVKKTLLQVFERINKQKNA
jgi:hypothetical protein